MQSANMQETEEKAGSGIKDVDDFADLEEQRRARSEEVKRQEDLVNLLEPKTADMRTPEQGEIWTKGYETGRNETARELFRLQEQLRTDLATAKAGQHDARLRNRECKEAVIARTAALDVVDAAIENLRLQDDLPF
jgi:hypothetical protein